MIDDGGGDDRGVDRAADADRAAAHGDAEVAAGDTRSRRRTRSTCRCRAGSRTASGCRRTSSTSSTSSMSSIALPTIAARRAARRGRRSRSARRASTIIAITRGTTRKRTGSIASARRPSSCSVTVIVAELGGVVRADAAREHQRRSGSARSRAARRSPRPSRRAPVAPSFFTNGSNTRTEPSTTNSNQLRRQLPTTTPWTGPPPRTGSRPSRRATSPSPGSGSPRMARPSWSRSSSVPWPPGSSGPPLRTWRTAGSWRTWCGSTARVRAPPSPGCSRPGCRSTRRWPLPTAASRWATSSR